MSCENCPDILKDGYCITISPKDKPALSYGVEFLRLIHDFETFSTTAEYRVCNCNPGVTGSGISHINFEICPIGPGPIVNADETLAANTENISNVEILAPKREFAFRSVKMEFKPPSVEPNQCAIVKIVYNGIYTQMDEGQVGVKIGGGRFDVPTTANFTAGLPLLLVCEEQCNNTCEFVCEDQGEDVIDIECSIVEPTSECLKVDVNAKRLNYCVSIAAPVEGTCQSTAYIPTCAGGMLECCVTVPYILFPSVKVEVLYGVDANFEGCEEQTHLKIPSIAQIEFTNQYCFYCPGTDLGPIIENLNECDLVSFDGDPDLSETGLITDIAYFICPEEG